MRSSKRWTMPDPLRIAVLKSRRMPAAPELAEDGGSVNATRVVAELGRRGHEVTIFTRARDPGQRHASMTELSAGIQLWEVPYRPSRAADLFAVDFEEGASFVRGVAQSAAFAASSFDRLHIHHWTSSVGLEEVVPPELPVVFTPHLLPSEKGRALGVPVPAHVAAEEQRRLRDSDAIIALSADERDAIGRHHGGKTHLIANGVDDGFFRLPAVERPMLRSPVRLGSVGRLCRQKGIDVLLDGAERLLAAGVPITLDVVGRSYNEQDYEDEIRRRAATAPLRDRVRIIDDATHDQIPTLLGGWDLYLQPSRYESQGIALLEAMASGRVVIATAVDAVLEYLADGTNGHTISAPPRGDDLAAAIERAIGDPGWTGVSQQARATALQFSWDATVASTCEVIEAAGSDRWLGDRHSAAAATALRNLAAGVSERLTIDYPESPILLLGSAARGPARAGSDLDIAVVEPGGKSGPVRQEWHADEPHPIDVRIFSTAHLSWLAAASEADFVSSAAETVVPDLLHGWTPLLGPVDDIRPLLSTIDTRRTAPSTADRVGRAHIGAAAAEAAAARRHAADGSVADAQLALQQAAQRALIGTLVRNGWIVQGAKRRPEIAAAMVRSNPGLRRVTDVVADIMGYARVTRSEVLELISHRQALRHQLHDELVKHGVTGPVFDRARRHWGDGERHLYYEQAVREGLHKGVVNHLRAYSGVPKVPGDLAAALGGDEERAASWCLESGLFSESLLERWRLLCEIPEDADVLERRIDDLVAALDGSTPPAAG